MVVVCSCRSEQKLLLSLTIELRYTTIGQLLCDRGQLSYSAWFLSLGVVPPQDENQVDGLESNPYKIEWAPAVAVGRSEGVQGRWSEERKQVDGRWRRSYMKGIPYLHISTYASTPRAAGRMHGRGGEGGCGHTTASGRHVGGASMPPYETTKAFRRASELLLIAVHSAM